MKVGLFFVCGRNFIILPQKSVPSLLSCHDISELVRPGQKLVITHSSYALSRFIKILQEPFPGGGVIVGKSTRSTGGVGGGSWKERALDECN